MQYQKRIIIRGLEEQKNMMIGALWSNSNYDDDKSTRKNAIASIEDNYQKALEKIHSIGRETEPDEDEIDKDNPFFAASERGLKKLFDKYEGQPLPKPLTKEEEEEYRRDIDQS